MSLAQILRAFESQKYHVLPDMSTAAQLHQAIRNYMISTRTSYFTDYYGDFLSTIRFPHRAGVSSDATRAELTRLMKEDGMDIHFYYSDCYEEESNEILEEDPYYESVTIRVEYAE